MIEAEAREGIARVFELPDTYPAGFCFNGGISVEMKMVDWFNPWPNPVIHGPGVEDAGWDEVKVMLLPFLRGKSYVKPGRRYVLITDCGESMVFSK